MRVCASSWHRKEKKKSHLARRVASIPGATVEHNKFCVSVHFRNCEAAQYNAVLGAVEATLRSRAELHVSRGRKVFEIKPQVRLSLQLCRRPQLRRRRNHAWLFRGATKHFLAVARCLVFASGRQRFVAISWNYYYYYYYILCYYYQATQPLPVAAQL